MEGQPKGREFRDIIKTWEDNEREREKAAGGGKDNDAENEVPAENGLDEAIKEEATEYDHANKQDRILGGERATMNDVPSSDDAREENV